MEIKSYLDNSATTKPYSSVSEAIFSASENSYGNPSSLHKLGFENSKIIKSEKEKILNSFNSKFSKVIYTGSGTEAINLAIRGIANVKKRNVGAILTSDIEHPATLETINNLAQDGWKKEVLKVNEHGLIDISNIKETIINEEVSIVSIMHVNNEVGTIQPIDEISKIIKQINNEKKLEKQIYFHVDGIQAYKKLNFNLENINMYSFSGHKIHGPKGIGCLLIDESTRLTPQITGGGQELGLRSGTEDVSGIIGLGEAINKKIDLELIKTIRDTLLSGIKSEINDIKVNSPEESTILNTSGLCAPHILNISFLGIRGEVLLHLLEEDGIFVSTGSACSSNKKSTSHVLKAMELREKEIEGAIRFSVGALNKHSEVEYVVDRLKISVNRLRNLKRKI